MAMNKPVLYVHPLCISSLRNVEEIINSGLKDRIEIVWLTSDSGKHFIVPSIPALHHEEILAIDPLEPELVKAYILGEHEEIIKYVPSTYNEARERFISSINSSSYLSLRILLRRDAIRDIIESDLLSIILRRRLGLDSSIFEEYRAKLLEELEDITNTVLEQALRVTAYNYLRENYLIYSGTLSREIVLNRYNFLVWLNAKISIGRAYTFHGKPDKRLIDLADKVVNLLDRRYRGFINVIRRRFELINDIWSRLGAYFPAIRISI